MDMEPPNIHEYIVSIVGSIRLSFHADLPDNLGFVPPLPGVKAAGRR